LDRHRGNPVPWKRWQRRWAPELNGYSRADRARQQDAGLADIDAGLRLRYEIRRDFAPYLGLAWVRRAGERAVDGAGDGAGQSAGAAEQLQWLIGVRFWF
jgi:copper resistance protein B